jgi:hypothetical protein
MDPYQSKLIEQVGEGILQVAQAEEHKLDEELKALDKLGGNLRIKIQIIKPNTYVSDEDDFEALRQKRKLMLQKQFRQDQDWRQLGHGR